MGRSRQRTEPCSVSVHDLYCEPCRRACLHCIAPQISDSICVDEKCGRPWLAGKPRGLHPIQSANLAGIRAQHGFGGGATTKLDVGAGLSEVSRRSLMASMCCSNIGICFLSPFD